MDIKRIVRDLKEERKRLEAAIAALEQIGTGAASLPRLMEKKAPAKRRRMSAAARRKISAAQKKRWEKQKAAK